LLTLRFSGGFLVCCSLKACSERSGELSTVIEWLTMESEDIIMEMRGKLWINVGINPRFCG